ncbi:MAG TPA: acetoacetate decarboxylase family protein [bacterium]|nr:acetoacetate decarboxylase family protein [bacterium]
MARRDIFEEISGFKEISFQGHDFKLPILYRRLDTFFAMFGADYRAVSALLPSPRLKPIKVWPGRAAITLNAFNYLDTDIGPYGEFSVGVPCLLKHAGRRLLGVYVHRLPVTTEIAMAGGIGLWGYPKFLCDMKFENTAAEHLVTLTAGEQLILELRVKKGGLSVDRAMNLGTFTVKDGEIVYTSLVTQGLARVMPQGLAALRTGPHEMGAELAALSLGDRAIATGDFLDLRLVLPEGERVGEV